MTHQRAIEAGARAGTCMFCGRPTKVGLEIFDQEGNIACKQCGEAEIAAQKSEANERAVLAVHNELEKITGVRPEFARQWSRQILARLAAEGFVVVSSEITEAMRWATWIDQSKHVGANDQEARILAGRRMIDNPEQKAMDESAYRAMITAAQQEQNDAGE